MDEALFLELESETLPPYTYLNLLRACTRIKSLPHARRVHAHIIRSRTPLVGLLGGYLVVTLAKCGAIEDAIHISRALAPCHRTVFSWTAIISAYVDSGCGSEALRMHHSMLQDGVQPNAFTYASLFKACGSTSDISRGRVLHVDAHAKGFTITVFVCNSLLSMYGKCGALCEAEALFCSIQQRNIVSWTAMLSVYVEQEQATKALRLYRQMSEEGVDPDQYTFVLTLQACGTLVGIQHEDEEASRTMARQIIQALHSHARRKGYASNVFVGTSLLCMYGKCGAVLQAEHVFGALVEHDAVSWNAMLSVYCEQMQEKKVLLLYRKMHDSGMLPNQLSFVIALEACSISADNDKVSGNWNSIIVGQAIHLDIESHGCASDVVVATALLNMYGKCGQLVAAENIFFSLSECNIVTCTAMITVYAAQGHAEKALLLYQQMRKEEMDLSDVLLTCILQACSMAGSSDTCQTLHFYLTAAGYEGVPFVAATLIHTYGSCACVADAHGIFCSLQKPSLEAWNACISSHARFGNSYISIQMLKALIVAGVKPDGVTFIAVLSGCSHAGLVVEGCIYFESMNRYHQIVPDVKHYGIMVDLLGRAGSIMKADKCLRQMPMQPDSTIWLCLLGACRVHGDVNLAEVAFENVVSILPEHVVAYILLSNTIY